MLALAALGVLEKTSAFPVRVVNEQLVTAAVSLRRGPLCDYYEELIAPLEEKGRHDLARAVRQKITEYHQAERRKKRRMTFIEPILEYDRKHFNGNLRRLKRIVYPWGGIWDK
jgi:hypothetical protein